MALLKKRGEWIAAKNRIEGKHEREALAKFIGDPGWRDDAIRKLRKETPAFKGKRIEEIIEFIWENKDTWLPVLISLITALMLTENETE